jgi:hypothetical protein
MDSSQHNIGINNCKLNVLYTNNYYAITVPTTGYKLEDSIDSHTRLYEQVIIFSSWAHLVSCLNEKRLLAHTGT